MVERRLISSLNFRKTARCATSKDTSCRSRSTACVAAVCKPLDIYFEGAEPLLNRSRRLTGSTYSKFRVLAPNSLIFRKTGREHTRKLRWCRSRSTARAAHICKRLRMSVEGAGPCLNRSHRRAFSISWLHRLVDVAEIDPISGLTRESRPTVMCYVICQSSKY